MRSNPDRWVPVGTQFEQAGTWIWVRLTGVFFTTDAVLRADLFNSVLRVPFSLSVGGTSCLRLALPRI
jgi:hypothetical protein